MESGEENQDTELNYVKNIELKLTNIIKLTDGLQNYIEEFNQINVTFLPSIIKKMEEFRQEVSSELDILQKNKIN